jgi:hypothetical protein
VMDSFRVSQFFLLLFFSVCGIWWGQRVHTTLHGEIYKRKKIPGDRNYLGCQKTLKWKKKKMKFKCWLTKCQKNEFHGTRWRKEENKFYFYFFGGLFVAAGHALLLFLRNHKSEPKIGRYATCPGSLLSSCSRLARCAFVSTLKYRRRCQENKSRDTHFLSLSLTLSLSLW